jgi:hypothetical protein
MAMASSAIRCAPSPIFGLLGRTSWDRQLPLAVCAIYIAAPTAGKEHTPFSIDRGAHPRLPLSASPAAAAGGGELPANHAHSRCGRWRLRRGSCWRRRGRRSGRRGWTRAGSTRCSRRPGGTGCCCGPRSDSRTLDAADMGKPRPRVDGPFKLAVAACPSPNACTLTLPRRMRCRRTVNVDRLPGGSSPSTSGPTNLRRPAQFRTRGRRASARWSGCSTARRSGASRAQATSCGGAAARRLTTSGCWWRSWPAALRRWPSTNRTRGG